VSSSDVFSCLFPLDDVENEIQLLSGFFCYSWLVYLLGFWLRNAPAECAACQKVIGDHRLQK